MSHNKQAGSAHAVVIVILVLALLGALGYIFYKNFMTSKTTSSHEASKHISSTSPHHDHDRLTQDFSLSLGGRTISMRYPEEWKVKSESTTTMGQDGATVSTITSPDGKYVVRASLYPGGLGGACGGDATFAWTRLTDLPNKTGEFMLEATVNPAADGDNTAYAVIEPNSVDKDNLVAGKNTCGTTLGYFNADGSGNPDSSTTPPASVTLGPDTNSSMALEQQNAWKANSNYELGRQILLSFKG